MFKTNFQNCDKQADPEKMCRIKPFYFLTYTQPAFTCSKLTIETLEQGVKYVQS